MVIYDNVVLCFVFCFMSTTQKEMKMIDSSQQEHKGKVIRSKTDFVASFAFLGRTRA